MISHLDSDEIKRVNLVSVECSKCKANLMGRGALFVQVPCQRTGEAKMPWYELILSSEQLSEGISEKIQSDFEALFIKAETPQEMALFCDTFPVPQFSMYFSPVAGQYASDLISTYSGDTCEKPDASEVTLLVGDKNSAWDLLE
ncbi:MAG: hypothetical protein C0610_17250 [Desulfobacteraceae bacterium]|nr:MAG: hypothetical protein C0610_17250 [Desulfobacteraceae bacterium]